MNSYVPGYGPEILPQAGRRGVHPGVYFGVYEGVVEDIDDPENLGRIRARTPAIHNKISPPTEEIRWADPCFTPGTSIVPDVGENVIIMFRHGNPQFPVYFGTFASQLSSPRIRGRLHNRLPPEPSISEPDDHLPPSVTGEGVAGDLQFVSPDRIIKTGGGLEVFQKGDMVSITGVSNQGQVQIAQSSPTELRTTQLSMVDENESTATITRLDTVNANNPKTFLEPAGNNSPPESYSLKESTEPRVRVWLGSPKGHTIYTSDDDSVERLAIVDRLGNELKFSCPVTAEENRANVSRRRLNEADDGTQLPIEKVVGKESKITLIDILGQILRFVANGNETGTTFGQSTIELRGPECGYMLFEEVGKKITIKTNPQNVLPDVPAPLSKGSIIEVDDNIFGQSDGNAEFMYDSEGNVRIKSSVGGKIPIGECTLEMDNVGNIKLTSKPITEMATIEMKVTGDIEVISKPAGIETASVKLQPTGQIDIASKPAGTESASVKLQPTGQIDIASKPAGIETASVKLQPTGQIDIKNLVGGSVSIDPIGTINITGLASVNIKAGIINLN